MRFVSISVEYFLFLLFAIIWHNFNFNFYFYFEYRKLVYLNAKWIIAISVLEQADLFLSNFE